MSDTKTLSIAKHDQTFVFRYEIGQEAKVLDALVELVNRGDTSFDWFVAAVLSHQLDQHLAKKLKDFLLKDFLPGKLAPNDHTTHKAEDGENPVRSTQGRDGAT